MVALVPLAPLAGKAALTLAGGSLTRAATRSLVSGAAFQAGAELVAQIAEWARSIDGNWDSQGDVPGSGYGPENGCWKLSSGGAIYVENSQANPGPPNPNPTGPCNVTSAVATVVQTFPAPDTTIVVDLTRTYTDRAPDTQRIQRWTGWKWELNTTNCDGVCSDEPYPDPGGEPLGPVDTGPIESGDCTINTTFYGFLANPDNTGNVQPVFVMEPAALRASGGVIVGDCNFEPTVVVGGGGDGNEPPRTFPMPPDSPGSDDWWSNIAKGIAAGASAAVVNAILEALISAQPSASFTLTAPCNKDEEGNPLTYTVDFPPETYQSRMMSWQVASADLLQQHLNWKTPTCNERPKLEGNWRTISFRSTESSPYGKSCIRKRFRYRSLSGIGLGALVDHWKDFTWTTGPVIVTHTGHTWGSLKVWAATADEGKRVIQHAAREAGFDADKVGEWGISNSASSRYGVSLPVKVDTTGGYYWITARDGASERPVVAIVSDI